MAGPTSSADGADDERDERKPLEGGGPFRVFTCAGGGVEGCDQEAIPKIVLAISPRQGTKVGTIYLRVLTVLKPYQALRPAHRPTQQTQHPDASEAFIAITRAYDQLKKAT